MREWECLGVEGDGEVVDVDVGVDGGAATDGDGGAREYGDGGSVFCTCQLSDTVHGTIDKIRRE